MLGHRSRHPLVRCAACLSLTLVSACTDDVTVADESAATDDDSDGPSTDEDSTESESSSSSDESTETDDTSDESDSDSDTGEPDPFCGDGNVDYGEECDDGNRVDDDGCSNACVSKCGAEFEVDLTIPEGWFDVQAMRARPQLDIELAGGIELDSGLGRLRYVRVKQDVVQAAVDSDVLGPAGTDELPQTHEVDAVAITELGDLIVLGTSTEVLVPGDAPVESAWLARFAADTLAEMWRVTIPSPEPDMRPVDVAALANGDPVVTMTVPVADGDDDILVRRYAVTDGSPVWDGTYSGELESGFSIDAAARVAVGPGDALWAAGVERVDWQTWPVSVIRFDPSDGSVATSVSPHPDTGNNHEQAVSDLAVGPAGRVAIAINVTGPALSLSTFAVYLLEDGEPLWSLTKDDLPWTEGAPYINPRVAFDDEGNVLIAGRYTHDFGMVSTFRPFVIKVAPDGSQLCNTRLGSEMLEGAVVPDNGVFHGGRGAINVDAFSPGGMGVGSGANWLIGLRDG